MNGEGLTPPPGRDEPDAREQWLLDAMFTTYSCVQRHCAMCSTYRERNDAAHRTFWRIIWGAGGGITVAGVLLKAFGVF